MSEQPAPPPLTDEQVRELISAASAVVAEASYAQWQAGSLPPAGIMRLKAVLDSVADVADDALPVPA